MRRIWKSLAMVLLVAALGGCQAMTGKTAGRNVDDANLTASVKANLVAEKASNLTRIDVDTNNGIVYLNGTVHSPQEKARAEQLALQVQGVKKVVNNLQVARG